MRRRSVFSSCVVALTCVVFAGVSITAQTPKPQVQESKPETARGAEPKLKSEQQVNNKAGSKRGAPAAKGGDKTRGGAGVCDVHIDNRSNLYIKIWVDGDYEGAVGPWGDLYTWAIAGPTQLFARADFDDGSKLWWGPVTVRCPSGGEYIWRLSR